VACSLAVSRSIATGWFERGHGVQAQVLDAADPAPIATVDGQGINLATQADALRAVIACAKARRGFTLFTLNLDHLVKRRMNAAFRAA
jgi:hypothetical protein